MTEIKLYNTKTRSKEVLSRSNAEDVRMYVCGPTVYDRAHLGNARPVIVFDVLYRLLRHVYGADHVTYVRNFTDVDDKINARAAKAGARLARSPPRRLGGISRIWPRSARWSPTPCRARRVYPADDRDDRGADRQGPRL